MRKTIFTIGHSTHPLERFIELLKRHEITALCDVRSKPYSRLHPQFNQESLKRSLQKNGIIYVFLGKELGARTDDPSCYDHGRVTYDRLAETDIFRDGLDRLREGAEKYTIALMCAEKEPLDCHRSILVSKYLEKLDFEVQHIHADGKLESQGAMVSRLLKKLHINESMFHSHEATVRDAYRIQGERIAYVLGKNDHLYSGGYS